VTFDNGPVNLLDPDTIDQLGPLIERIENDPDLTVVVFRSEKPGYFMARWDFLADNAHVAEMQPGPTGLHPYLDNFVRLSKAASGHDLGDPRPHPRRWQRVRARHRHPLRVREGGPGPVRVGVGAVPGGGPMARLGRLVGRGRALEILLGGDDIPAGLAADYGYVNRAHPGR
jgi:enoyl-CoA hydratase/carnithine racemase